MSVFLQLKRLFHDQSYFSVIVIHAQLCKQTASKKKIGSISLINTNLVLTPNVLEYFRALPLVKTYIKY